MFMLSDKEFIDEMLRKIAVRYQSESDFMRAMHKSPQNMTNWKARGVPAHMKPIIAKELDIDWLEENSKIMEEKNDYGENPKTQKILSDLRRMTSNNQLSADDLDLLLIIARRLSVKQNPNE